MASGLRHSKQCDFTLDVYGLQDLTVGFGLQYSFDKASRGVNGVLHLTAVFGLRHSYGALTLGVYGRTCQGL